MTTGPREQRHAHLRDYWRIVWQGKWMVVTIALLISLLTAMATFLQTPIYRAASLVEVQPKAKSVSPNADFSQLGVTSWSWAAEERYLNTQMEIIRSPRIAAAVLAGLGLDAAPEVGSLPDAATLASRVKVEVLPDTYILQISIEDPNPELARMLANGLAKAYIDSNIETALQNARRVIDGLYEQIEPIRDAIAQKERARIDLARSADFYAPEAQETSVESRLQQLQAKLTEVQIARGELEATFNAIEEIERRGDSYDSLPVVAEDPAIQKLKAKAVELQQELEELSSSYGAFHPKVLSVKAALEEVPRGIQAETERIITRIKTEYSINKRREQDLIGQLRSAREQSLGMSETQSQVGILNADIEEDRKIYELITARVKEIDLNQETLVNNVRLLQEAGVPTRPVRPQKALNLAAGLLLGLFLGIGTVFFVDYLDNTIRSSEDVERFLKLPLLAMVPRIGDRGRGEVKEAFQTLRTSILFSSKNRSARTILVTSAAPGEGKSNTAFELGRTLAAAGDRVVLVDCDMRRPTVHVRAGVPRDHGLVNSLMDDAPVESFRQYVKPVRDVDNLGVITCGPLPPNPVQLFGLERFKDLIAQLRAHHEWVLLDSPPVASVSDSIVLGSMAEMTVLVIRHNQNDKELIRRCVEQLHKVGANVIGAVLNAIDLKRVGYHDYYYASYKYGETEDREPASREPSPAGRRQRRHV